PPALPMFIIGMAVFTLGLYGVSRTQHQLRQQMAESRSLAVVSQALQSDLHLESLLRTVYEQVARLLDAGHFLVALYDGQQLRFPLAMRGGQPYPPAETGVEAALLQHILRTQQPLLLSRTSRRDVGRLGLALPDEPLSSCCGVPLLAGGRLLGAMLVFSDDPQRPFKPADLRLLTTLGATAAVAIDNAQLYDRQARRAEQLATLNRVMSLLTLTLSEDAVLDTVVSSASLIPEASGVALYLCEGEAIKLARYAGLSDAYAASPPELLLTDFRQEPALYILAEADPRAAAQRDLLRREGKSAWMEVPLLIGASGLGVLVLYYQHPRRFSDTSIEIIRAFANQAAQAIKNARQYTTTDQALERRAEQMFALALLGRELTGPMSPAAICDLALRRALELTPATAGLIVLQRDPDSMPLIAAQAGYPAHLPDEALRYSLVADVLRAGHALAVPDTRRAALPPLLEGAQSQLAVPIMRQSEPWGVIVLESDRRDAFHEEDLHFLTQLTNHMTIALDNSSLFARIAEGRDRLEVILNAMTEAIVLVDRCGVIALANPRVRLIGLDPDRLIGQPISSLLADRQLDLAAHMGFESADHFATLLDELHTPGSWLHVAPATYSLDGDDGALFIQRQVIPVSGADGEPVGVLLVFYDQTEERELMQMRDDLSRMIVHDLRSPLAAVTTGLKLLREVVPADAPYRAVVDSTADASQRAIRKLLSRVDSLLDISRTETGQLNLDLEPTELATLVDSVCMELSPLAHELDVRLHSEVGGDLPLLKVDADKIERVLQNLVDNALKFSPADSTITIRAQASSVAQGYLRVDVADEGPGVPDEDKTRLFERFAQIKGRRGARRGIGLGLTYCKLAVEAHGGNIWIEDNPGGGSIFAFTLPVAEVAEGRVQQQAG
ncbi:MAG: GAF domain-containing protein, partial [Chloroflexi bacterium]|nr:GAF domain-containing protein [Chloroflexota bacterium]